MEEFICLVEKKEKEKERDSRETVENESVKIDCRCFKEMDSVSFQLVDELNCTRGTRKSLGVTGPFIAR